MSSWFIQYKSSKKNKLAQEHGTKRKKKKAGDKDTQEPKLMETPVWTLAVPWNSQELWTL